jgi:GT2 family glycosyltransferase
MNDLNEKTPIPVLGIPHLNRADLLERGLKSIDYPVQTLVLVDNSNGMSLNRVPGTLGRMLGLVPVVVERVVTIFQPNAGVAASWNQIVKQFPAPWWLISNDDIEFAPGDLGKLAAFVAAGGRRYCADPDHCTYGDCPTAFCDRGTSAPGIIYGNHGASWFALTAHGADAVGLFDENIFPAYLEDCDWSYRADLLGVRRCDVPDVHARHGDDRMTGSCTVNAHMEIALENMRTHGGNFEYYRRKWGGLNGTEVYRTPFNAPHWPVWAWKFETGTRARQQWARGTVGAGIAQELEAR